jgi:hypothetical protein
MSAQATRTAAITQPARTIDEVLERLELILTESRERRSRVGYFAALYKRVTARILLGIQRGEFRDGTRVAALDVTFANRYLDAYGRYAAGAPITDAWRVAFEATSAFRPLVLQHLLLGMNAHINLDLGIAVAEIAAGSRLEDLAADFEHINSILAELTETVRREMERIWPALRWLDRLARDEEDAVINFSMTKARDAAWRLAERLTPLSREQRRGAVDEADICASELGLLVRGPGFLTSTWLLLIRLGELASVRAVIDILNR